MDAGATTGDRFELTAMRFTARRVGSNLVGSCTAAVVATATGPGAGRCSVALGSLLSLGSFTVTVELVGHGVYTAPAATGRMQLALSVL